MTIEKDIMPNEDIIPVTFMGGTGGNFLCHFIVSAKRNIQDVIVLSHYGNAHENCLKDLPEPTTGMPSPDIDKINHLLAQSPYDPTEKPYYTSAHIADIDLVNANFKRSIRITYDVDDISEISSTIYGKFIIESYNPNTHPLIHSPSRSKCKIWALKWQSKCVKIENMPNVLFVSWKELLKESADDLISRLSIFTNISAENFSKETLLHWRDKTQYCIDTLKETK